MVTRWLAQGGLFTRPRCAFKCHVHLLVHGVCMCSVQVHVMFVCCDADTILTCVLAGTVYMHNVRTVLVEIIRDSKNNFFFQRSRIIMVEISRSQIIRITNYSARTYMYMCAQVQLRFVSRATTTLWSRRSRRSIVNQGSTTCWTNSVTSATVRGATWTASVRKDIQTARR